MSGQGSSSSDTAVRVEVYLDGRPEAVQVLTAPPFRFQLDTAALEEGEHTLRLVRVDAAGRRRERTIPFAVEHGPGLEVQGLEPGATVTGRVDVDVVTPAAPPATPAPVRGPATWLYVLATVLILGGIWVFFMVVPIYSSLVPAPTEASAGSQAAGPPVDQALLKTGEQLYTSDCASCHKPSGQGMPPAFPALAGNSFLSDATATVKRIFDGSGAMPSHPSYSATQLAAVATYVRNSWGNSYGGVSVDDAAAAAPKASTGGAAPSSGSSTSGASTSGASTSGAAASGASSSGAASSGAASSGAASSTPSSSASAPSSSSASSSSASSSSPSTASPSTASPATASPSTAAPSTAAAASDAMQAGQKLYTADCAGCHQPNGAGMPPTFPALAGNSFLSDPAAVAQRIFDGKGTMPSHPSYTAKQLADVATYIRNSWGNAYGPVSADQAAQAVPKAAP